ncbi:MAG: TIM barrel protein [Chloroflexi bacterium]|nr:TIM barrel protein [Chloroflexota bacterium]
MPTIHVGNAPCSWGVVGVPAPPGETAGYVRMLDELSSTGYTGTELGDWGFMPTAPKQLRAELDKRNLTMVGTFVGIAFADPAAVEPGEAAALRVARLLAAVSEKQTHKPFINLADANVTDPVRTLNAGRVTPAMGLSAAQWDRYVAGVERVARAIVAETGLPVLFHPHCAGFVETPDEIDQLLKRTDPAVLNIVFDTGHYAYGAQAQDSRAVLAAMDRYAGRIKFMHFKDCQPNVAEALRREKLDYNDAIARGVFCELGKGMIDFPAVLNWLRQRQYDGWVLVEQDVLPGMGTPKDSAQRNRDYLRSIGL